MIGGSCWHTFSHGMAYIDPKGSFHGCPLLRVWHIKKAVLLKNIKMENGCKLAIHSLNHEIASPKPSDIYFPIIYVCLYPYNNLSGAIGLMDLYREKNLTINTTVMSIRTGANPIKLMDIGDGVFDDPSASVPKWGPHGCPHFHVDSPWGSFLLCYLF